MGKHLSGNPTFVVENMPGASFLIGTNYLYRQAKPDGLTLGNWIGTLVLHQLTGREGIKFDARKFEYVGAPVKNHDTCVMTRASGIDSAQKWQSSPIPVKMGATPPGSTPYDNTMVLKEALGLPMQIVSGYKGTAEIRLAVDAGEIAGLCGLAWASIKVTWRKQLDSGEVKVVCKMPRLRIRNCPMCHWLSALPKAKWAASSSRLRCTMSAPLRTSIRFHPERRKTECKFSGKPFRRP